MAGLCGVVTVKWLPIVLYFHIERMGYFPDIYEYISKWLSVTCKSVNILKTSAAVSKTDGLWSAVTKLRRFNPTQPDSNQTRRNPTEAVCFHVM